MEGGSIERLTKQRQEQREREARQPSLVTMEVRQRPEIEDPYLVACLKLKGEVPIKKDLNAGELLTVQVAGPDGEVIAAGLYEVGLPGFKDVKMNGVGIIGTERVHTATFDPSL